MQDHLPLVESIHSTRERERESSLLQIPMVRMSTSRTPRPHLSNSPSFLKKTYSGFTPISIPEDHENFSL